MRRALSILCLIALAMAGALSLHSTPTFVVKNLSGGGTPDFCIISTNNISFYYRLHEATNVAKADATGQCGSLTADLHYPARHSGIISNCAGFNSAITNSLLATPSAVMNITNGDATITCWINFTNLGGGDQKIIAKTGFSAGMDGYWLGTGNATNIAFSLVGTNGMGFPTYVILQATNIIVTNTWYFVAAQFRRASNDLAIYINAGPVQTTNFNSAIQPKPTGDSLRVGAALWTGMLTGKLWGRAAEIAKWDRMLTTNEVSCLFHSGSPGKNQTYPFTL